MCFFRRTLVCLITFASVDLNAATVQLEVAPILASMGKFSGRLSVQAFEDYTLSSHFSKTDQPGLLDGYRDTKQRIGIEVSRILTRHSFGNTFAGVGMATEEHSRGFERHSDVHTGANITSDNAYDRWVGTHESYDGSAHVGLQKAFLPVTTALRWHYFHAFHSKTKIGKSAIHSPTFRPQAEELMSRDRTAISLHVGLTLNP